MIKRILFLLFALLLLVYLAVPEPGNIEEFLPLPDSTRSTLSGDTTEVPNIKAYFTNQYRDTVIPYYYQNYTGLHRLPFKPLRLNYPPEHAFVAVKDQTQSTYLEEFVYPLRGSLFVNGLEQYDKDGLPRYWGAARFIENDVIYDSKVTLHLYPVSVGVKLSVWLGILMSVYLTWKIGGRIVKKD